MVGGRGGDLLPGGDARSVFASRLTVDVGRGCCRCSRWCPENALLNFADVTVFEVS